MEIESSRAFSGEIAVYNSHSMEAPADEILPFHLQRLGSDGLSQSMVVGSFRRR
jgi:hypothetical protein